MVVMQLPAEMRCDEPGCQAKEPVQLALMAAGGFVFKAQAEDQGRRWQVLFGAGGLGSPFVTRCPLHHVVIETPPAVHLPRGIQVGPAGPRVKNGR